MKITVVRPTTKVVVTAPEQHDQKVVVSRVTQRITVKRDGTSGPQGPAGPPGQDGAASIPEIITGGSF